MRQRAVQPTAAGEGASWTPLRAHGSRSAAFASTSSLVLDFTATPIIQPKLSVGDSADPQEREADAVAERAMRGSAAPREAGSGTARGFAVPDHLCAALGGTGQPLDGATRAYFEPRIGHDFSNVRVHADREAHALSASFGAKAFTHGNHIYFGQGRAPGADHLTAHELTHVAQQNGRPGPIRRTVEVRPPGRGEASAYDRRDELVKKMNKQTTAVEYSLPGAALEYKIKDESKLTPFDKRMIKFIDGKDVIPLRLITKEGRTRENPRQRYQPVIGDHFMSGYFDLDDMMATDDMAFQSLFIHILAERGHTPNYAKRMGMDDLNTQSPAFKAGHDAGHEAQADHFREVFNDPNIVFNYEEGKPNGDAHIVFRSKPGNYRIFVIAHNIRGELTRFDTKVLQDKKWFTVDEFLAARAAAAKPAAPKAQPAPAAEPVAP